MYQVQLIANGATYSTVGQVTVDAVSNNGDMNVQLKGGVVSTQLFVKFCSFGKLAQGCQQVDNFTTDASGNANVNMKFPTPGTWVGVFYLGKDSSFDPFSGQALYQTDPAAYTGNFGTTQSYRVALVPDANVTGGLDGVMLVPAPLASGFVSEVGDTLHVEIHGGKPNTQFDVGFCPNSIFGSGCNQYLNNTFMTDASGNGSIDMKVYSGPSEIYFADVHNTRGQGYVTGFVVQ